MEATELRFLNVLHHLPQLSLLENYFSSRLELYQKAKNVYATYVARRRHY